MNLTGLQVGGLIRVTARVNKTQGGSPGLVGITPVLNNVAMGEIQWTSNSVAIAIWLNQEIALTGTNEQMNSAFDVTSPGISSTAGANFTSGRMAVTAADISSGNATLDIRGQLGNAGDTITLKHWCVEYIPPVD
jgi:hypothetical protein